MDVTMPQLGETVSEATVTCWRKRVGDRVREGEPLFDVATDKVDSEIPATVDGILREILVAEDETVPVGTRLAVIVPSVEPDAEPDAEGNGQHRLPRHHQLTPLVRRLLREHNLTAAQVVGTGPNGRITRHDVRAAAARPAPVATPAPAPVAEPVPAGSYPVSPALAAEAEPVPFNRIRRRTAEHMVASKAISPHTLMVMEVDYARVDAVRAGTGLTYLPFVARATVDALAAFPHLNASVAGDRLLVHRQVNLGIAVDLDGDGLVVPVIRGADGLRLRALARAVVDLAGRARAAGLGPDEFADGTFTISNPGPYGTLLTAAIINQPQVAILATDAVRPRPVAVPMPDGGYAVAVHPVGNLALTFDHRAVDGGYAGRFLNRLKEILEQRDWTAEL